MSSFSSPSSPSTRPPSVHSTAATTADGAHPHSSTHQHPHVDVLLLGSGWTSSFLLPRLWSNNISFAYTNRSGIKPDHLALPGKKPIKWTMPSAGDSRIQWRKSFKAFPTARCVVVVVPLKDTVAAKELVAAYQAHCVEKRGGVDGAAPPKWVVLGSTSVYGPGQHESASPVSKATPRSAAEAAVLSLLKKDATILQLAGLYGGSTRHPLNWLPKVIADDKEKLAVKDSLHLVHGKDVAEAILGVLKHVDDDESTLWGKRWIVTDGRVYDWWQLVTQLPTPAEEHKRYEGWVKELQKERGVKALPRKLERELDSDAFWAAIGKKPTAGPAYETDVPISPVTGLAVSTDEASAAATGSAPMSAKSSSASLLQGKSRPYTPVIPQARLQDLVACLQHEIRREETCPLPPIFEGRREAMGLPRERFLHLRKTWLEYVTANGNGHGVSSGDGSAPASWQGAWKEFLGYEHYVYPDERLTGKYVPGVTIDGLHFVRVGPSEVTRSQRRVEPLVFLHGWPGSCLEGLFVARALANPGPDVPLSSPAFEVIIPSHPGYLFSGTPLVNEEDDSGPFTGPDGDILVKDVAALVNDLMVDLGHERYTVTAGDWGAFVARRLAVDWKRNVKAVHLNFIPAPPPTLAPALVPKGLVDAVASRVPGVSSLVNLPRVLGGEHFIKKAHNDDEPDSPNLSSHLSLADRLQRLLGLPHPLTHSESLKVQRGLLFQNEGSAYAQFHRTRPSTLANLMHTSPSALLSWVGEKFDSWTDATPYDHLILESLTLWFLTDTMARSLYPYRNRAPGGPVAQAGAKENYIDVPVGFSDAPCELVPPPLEWAKATARIEWYRRHERGGHFLSMERPHDYAEDVREFVGGLSE